jgi:hypothetical protein
MLESICFCCVERLQLGQGLNFMLPSGVDARGKSAEFEFTNDGASQISFTDFLGDNLSCFCFVRV